MKAALFQLAIVVLVCSALDIAVLRRQVETGGDESEMRFSADEIKAVSFLRRYGYLPPSSTNSRLPLTRALFTNALNNYQVMANIPIKNRLDQTALSSMEEVRCANVDVRRSEGVARFEIHAPRWRKGNLTWRISRYPTKGHLSRPIVDRAMRRAMQMWSNISRIDFVQITDASRGSVDIDIKFESSNYDSTCDMYFRVGELAHATLSRSPAKVHFNGRVAWVVGVPTGSEVDLVAVAGHEIGHVLGLDHSADRTALMYAGYRRQNSELGRDDIQAVRYLYGARRGSGLPPVRPTAEPDQEPEEDGEPVVSMCPKTVTPKMPDRRRSLCAAVYVNTRCQGRRLPIESGNKTRQLDDSWDNEISSAEVNPGCTLKLCHRPFFAGGCIDLEGGAEGRNFNRLPLGYNELTTSLACICDEENVGEAVTEPPSSESAESEHQPLARGREPPAFIPSTSKSPTCAVLVAGWEPGSTRAWIEVETAMRMPSSLVGVTYMYMATRRGCTLFYCTRPAFGGVCEFLGPSRHSEFEEGFEVGSLSCECK